MNRAVAKLPANCRARELVVVAAGEHRLQWETVHGLHHGEGTPTRRPVTIHGHDDVGHRVLGAGNAVVEDDVVIDRADLRGPGEDSARRAPRCPLEERGHTVEVAGIDPFAVRRDEGSDGGVITEGIVHAVIVAPGRPPRALLRYRAAPMAYRCVIFDLGGVVFPSPFDAFDTYERAAGLPDRFIRTVVANSAETGAWARYERSDVDFAGFCVEFEAECSTAGGTVDAAALMRSISQGFAPRPSMVEAITTIRARGLRVGALTNNWTTTDRTAPTEHSQLGFDTIVESAIEGIRKPDPRIYLLVCERLSVQPDECVFLDDLGVNLKPARAMGMATIKVLDAPSALDELAAHLGFALDGTTTPKDH